MQGKYILNAGEEADENFYWSYFYNVCGCNVVTTSMLKVQMFYFNDKLYYLNNINGYNVDVFFTETSSWN